MYTFRLLVLFFVVLVGAYIEHQARNNVRKARREMRRSENAEVTREENATAETKQVNLNSPVALSTYDKDAARNVLPTNARIVKSLQIKPEASHGWRHRKINKEVRKSPDPLTPDRPALLLIRSPSQVEDISFVRQSTPR